MELTFRHEMTDLELCIQLVPEAGEHYSRALDVMTAYPDYALGQFRIVLEFYTSMLAQRFRVDIDHSDLFQAINELSASQIIDHSLRSDLHDIRIAGNSKVHAKLQKNANNAGAEVISSKKANGAGDLESAVDARKKLVRVFGGVFLLLNKDKKLPAITCVEVGDFTSQQILWNAVTTLGFEAKMAAGLILEAQSMAPVSRAALIVGYSEAVHQKTTVRMAAELYWAACEISAGIDRFSFSEVESKGGKEACLFKLANTEALYRYAQLTFNKNEGEESHRLGVKAMEIAATRGYPSACVEYGDLLRQNGQYEDALVLLSTALSKGEISAFAGLAFLYLEKESPFYSQEKAEQYLQDGVARGCNHSTYLLGRWLYEGKELAEDKERGQKHLEAASEAGHGVAEKYVKYCVDDRLANLLQREFLNMLPMLGPHTDAPKHSRKGPCPCGSGKKYKRCCGE